jgi:acetyltransferase-like isoleucine patch superfamily enzyme
MQESAAQRGGRLARFLAAPWSIRLHLVHTLWRRMVTGTFYRPMFAEIGSGSVIYRPLLLANTECMRLGRRVLVRGGARLEVVRHGQEWTPSLEIGDDVNIEQNVHIVCHDRVRIGDRVSITGNCAIVDVNHPHEAAFSGGKIGETIDPRRSHVTIGSNTFLGFGTVVLPNVTIGRNCLIGAGSVVSADIPDDSVAAGAPARVVRTRLKSTESRNA